MRSRRSLAEPERPGGVCYVPAMQGARDEDTDRWFGMFRSVGVGVMEESLALAVRGEVRQRSTQTALMALLLLGLYFGLFWWRPTTFDSLTAMLPASAVGALVQLGMHLRVLSAIRPGDKLEFFEGQAPLVQGFRDSVTDKLFSQGLVTTSRSHRLTVHLGTGLLLEIDGKAVPALVGNVVVTARVPQPIANAPATVGHRRPLTANEVEELEAISTRGPRQDWIIVILCGLAATLLSAWALIPGAHRDGLWLIPTIGLVTVAGVRFIQTKSAEATRARVAADRAGGLVCSSPTTWRLPVMDIVWERDGLPGFKRLERGGLAGARRSVARPHTF